jgi:hypothetical protein
MGIPTGSKNGAAPADGTAGAVAPCGDGGNAACVLVCVTGAGSEGVREQAATPAAAANKANAARTLGHMTRKPDADK